MRHKLRQRAGNERGFTLIELLVVILIIGILAAIAIPSGLNQAVLNSYEATIQTASGNGNAYISSAGPIASGAGYTVVSTSTNGDTFTITRAANGVVSRNCAAAGANTGGCPSGSW